MKGQDHDGYCSGEEANDSSDILICYDLMDKQNMPKLNKNKFTRQRFDYVHHGCTSGGSGYCKGFHQSYSTIWARSIEGTRYLMALKDVYAFLTLNGFKEYEISEFKLDVDEWSITKLKRKYKYRFKTNEFVELLVIANNLKIEFIKESEKLF